MPAARKQACGERGESVSNAFRWQSWRGSIAGPSLPRPECRPFAEPGSACLCRYPVDSNAITLTYNSQNGNILFDSSIPITDAGAQINAAVFSYYHAFSLFGRSANVVASLPYGG